ncbi:MAG: cadmium-translocating P-type ATPase [Clostridia bacterium]|nr:cadmium-translocating P-type ATPase [Clostridia bacterium]
MFFAHRFRIFRIIFAVLLTVLIGILNLQGPFWIELLLYLVPYIVVGYQVLFNAFRNIINGQIFDEQFLMSLATIGAFVIGEYPEAVMVMVFFQIGELFEKIAVGKSRKSISELMDIVPDTANLLKDGVILTVSPDEIKKGDIIVVKAGERIALDGVIISGETHVDTSALTGEPLPKKMVVGDYVISGCVNLSGLIKIRVENEFYESTASKIIELVESSTLKKAKSEAFITKFARYYTPCVVIGAIIISIIAGFLTANAFDGLKRGLVFLVVSCPCALVISVPLSFFGGIGGASRKGILIKGSEYIEALSGAQTVVFDKTGTLTNGRFSVTQIETENITREEFLKYAAYAEATSTHPVAQCICREYAGDVDISLVSNVNEYSGAGVGAEYNGKRILIGNRRLMVDNKVEAPYVEGQKNVVYLAVDGQYKGYAVLDDEIKPSSEDAIKDIKKQGIKKSVMLTGDLHSNAVKIANNIAIDQVYAELLPQDKVEVLEKLILEKSKNKTVVYVGDGINDAPVISRADVGIAMGAMGSDAAIEAADVVLMDDDPIKVSEAIRISKRTMNIVRQNIVFALGIKGIVLILGAIGLANMWLAVFADVGVSVIAIANAMRALKK